MVTIEKLMSLRGRRALITGAAGGIGRTIARTLAELGADLLLVDRPGQMYGDLVGEIEGEWQVAVETLECDLELQEERDRLVEWARGRVGEAGPERCPRFRRGHGSEIAIGPVTGRETRSATGCDDNL